MPSSSSRDGTNDRRSFMPLWSTVYGLAQITRSDEGDHPYDTLDMSGDGQQNNPMARWEAYGDVNIPPTNSYAVYFKLGEGGIELPWGTKFQGRPEGLKRGTRALYSDGGNTIILHGAASSTPKQIEINAASGAKVIIDQDGNIKVDAATGKDVIVNGGTLNMARKTDEVKVTIPALTVITAVAGGTLNANPIVLDGTITGNCAQHFKG